jgi:DNA-binding HxlR family transcriptional regulator
MFAAEKIPKQKLEPCGTAEHEDCGLRLILDRLGEKWTVMTISELASGPRRYNDLERSLGAITQRMLTLTVRRLERDGLISRSVEATNPPSVTYALTTRGRSFANMVVDLVDWSRTHRDAILSSQNDFDTQLKS